MLKEDIKAQIEGEKSRDKFFETISISLKEKEPEFKKDEYLKNLNEYHEKRLKQLKNHYL